MRACERGPGRRRRNHPALPQTPLLVPKGFMKFLTLETRQPKPSNNFCQVWKHRLAALYEDLAPEYCNGFRKGRGRSDSIYVLLEVLRMRKRKGLNSWVTFFDIQKYFDRLPQRFIWKSMHKCGVTEKMIRVVRSTLEGATCVLHIDGETRDVEMNDGSGQGTSLGPTLASFAILPILTFWVKRWYASATMVTHDQGTFPVFVNSFADDTSTVNGEREGATETGGDFVSYLGDFGLNVHVGSAEDPKSKSVCVFVPYCDEERELQCQDPLLLPNGKQIPCVDKTVHLGHAISGTLSDADHVSVRASKGSQVFGALGPCLLRCSYVWTDVKRLVFESMILPTMLDGIECCILSTVMIEEMTTVYHRLIRSALHITPYKQRKWKLTSEELLSRLGLQPLHHYIDLKVLLGVQGMLRGWRTTDYQSSCETVIWIRTIHQGGNGKPTGSASYSRYIAKRSHPRIGSRWLY